MMLDAQIVEPHVLIIIDREGYDIINVYLINVSTSVRVKIALINTDPSPEGN